MLSVLVLVNWEKQKKWWENKNTSNVLPVCTTLIDKLQAALNTVAIFASVLVLVLFKLRGKKKTCNVLPVCTTLIGKLQAALKPVCKITGTLLGSIHK